MQNDVPQKTQRSHKRLKGIQNLEFRIQNY